MRHPPPTKHPSLAHRAGVADSDIVWIDVSADTRAAEGPSITARQTAEKFRLTTRTLSLYARRGLVTPTRQGRCRVYGPLDQLRLAQVVQARRLGFSLDEIVEIVAAEHGRASPEALSPIRRKCADRISRLEAELSEIHESLIGLRRIQKLL
jgi:DNA-binding transcriptional MerR regulator